MNSTVKRSISGAVYVAVLIFCITYSFYSQALILLGFLVLANVELNRLFKKMGGYNLVASSILSLSVFFASWAFITEQEEWSKLGLIAIPVLLFVFLSVEVFSSKEGYPVRRLTNTITGVIYITLPLSLALFVGAENAWVLTGQFLLIIFIFLWFNDTFAFVFGSWLGKHKLLERVSPNKTIEGFVGGVLGSYLAIFAIQYFISVELSLIEWFVLATLVSITGTVGDLFESMLKRAAGVKDSGNVIPGHGGVLDRLDSFLFAVPFVYFYLQILELI